MKYAFLLLALMFAWGATTSFAQQNDFPAIPQSSYTSFKKKLCIDTIQIRQITNYEPWIRKQIDSTDHLRRLRDDLNYTNSQIRSAGKLYEASNALSLLGILGIGIGSMAQRPVVGFGLGGALSLMSFMIRWSGDSKLAKLDYLNRSKYLPQPHHFRNELEMIAPTLTKEDPYTADY